MGTLTDLVISSNTNLHGNISDKHLFKRRLPKLMLEIGHPECLCLKTVIVFSLPTNFLTAFRFSLLQPFPKFNISLPEKCIQSLFMNSDLIINLECTKANE